MKLTELRKWLHDDIEGQAEPDRTGNEIAVIGMACRFPGANNPKEYWEILAQGLDCVRPFPERRKQINQPYLVAKGIPGDTEYFDAGFLDEVDLFDCELFSISPREASLMSPNQRIFLELAYQALEDAGYSGKRVAGSRTGVYIGHSTDFGISYKEFIEAVTPEQAGMAIPGNLNSIMAGRIAYLLDLKGPSLLVDTACSSALSAVHLACKAILNRECDMAIAGSVKADLLPLLTIREKEDELGITSRSGKSLTFDEKADGTGLGEGAGVLVLKSLDRALKDRDFIHAVIKGSSMNQDGSSMGLTAPNAQAQQEVIISAWKNAGIHPETLTYMEAHGTGTNLGDPVELNGIRKAFEAYTDKKQLCAIGSVKTNLGHLDHAAGMAGLLKVILAIKHQQIPPTLHFQRPNRKIRFELSPVYVNDCLRPWNSDPSPRRGGISAFGLSGTNCHVIVEEPPTPCEPPGNRKAEGGSMFTLSARSRETLLESITQFHHFLNQRNDLRVEDICYTVNVGRKHQPVRVAILADSLADLLDELQTLITRGFQEDTHRFFGEHRLVSSKKLEREAGEITEEELLQLSAEANKRISQLKEVGDRSASLLISLCQSYVQGADLDWQALYTTGGCQTLSLPSSPLMRRSCWVHKTTEPLQNRDNAVRIQANEIPDFHPLVQNRAETKDGFIYSSSLSLDRNWELRDHLVGANHVLPGTAWIEMVATISRREFPSCTPHIRDLLFLSPFMVEVQETKVIQTILQQRFGQWEFIISSKSGSDWVEHASGILSFADSKDDGLLDLEEIKRRCSGYERIQFSYELGNQIETGPRWESIQEINAGHGEYLAFLQLPEPYVAETELYTLHPALMDEAVNIALRTIGDGLFLPFSYKSMIIRQPLPASVYSHVILQENPAKHADTATFQVTLSDRSGNICASIEGYTVKKVHDNRFANGDPVYRLKWVVDDDPSPLQESVTGRSLLVFHSGSDQSRRIIAEARKNHRVTEIVFGRGFQRIDADHYVMEGNEEDYERLFREVKAEGYQHILHLASVEGKAEIDSLSALNVRLHTGLYSLFDLTKALLWSQMKSVKSVTVLSSYAQQVTGEEESIHPHSSAIAGLCKVAGQENAHLKYRFVDIDEATEPDLVLREVFTQQGRDEVSFRQGIRYVRQIERASFHQIPKPVQFHTDGVYVITGGMGGIGLELCKFLASKEHVHLAVIGRTPIGLESSVQDPDSSAASPRAIALEEIRRSGSELEYDQGDVSDMESMRPLLEKLRNRYGSIRGIFHCAGVAGNGFLIHKDRATFDQVIKPKLQGTWVLDHLTESDPLDFFVLFSSITSFLAGAGQGDYTAANQYQEVYASYRNLRGKETLSIQWPAWSETGMAVQYGTDLNGEIFEAMTTKDALRAFEGLLGISGSFIPGVLHEGRYLKQRDHLSIRLSDSLESSFRRSERSADGREDLTHREAPIRRDANGLSSEDVEKSISEIWSEILGMDFIDPYRSFFNMGGDSILATFLLKALDKRFPGVVDISDIFTYPTVMEMAAFIKEKKGVSTLIAVTVAEQTEISDTSSTLSYENSKDIAIIGMSGRFPQAANLSQFWENLISEVDCIRDYPEERVKDIPEGLSKDPETFYKGGFLDRIDLFDPDFFTIAQREAEFMSPAQRMMLEVAYEAMEDAGFGGTALVGSRTGVYIGMDHTNRMTFIPDELTHDPLAVPGKWTGLLSSRISYTFNLKGPSVVVDTACSSGLVSVHLACKSILNGECDLAIAGGICLETSPSVKGDPLESVTSEDEKVRPFDEKANGTVWGEGAGAIILKSYSAALADGDPIYAVIKGSAMNNDGASHGGITAPDALAQEEVIVAAWKDAGVDPTTISFLEAHGTGTKLGDPIEIKGLTNAFRRFTNQKQFCAVGSVKGNIGHTVAASGIASLIKVVLSLEHKMIPTTLHYERPNSFIDFQQSPLFVNNRILNWTVDHRPRRAGVSSFGFSGTNCHMVLEDASSLNRKHVLDNGLPGIFVISAKTKASLRALLNNFADYFTKQEPDLRDACYTTQVGRGHYTYRFALLVSDVRDLIGKIHTLLSEDWDDGEHTFGQNRSVYYGQVAKHPANARFNQQAEALVEQIRSQGMNSVSLLEELCSRYAGGADIPWSRLYQDRTSNRRIHLPVYAFERRRCWPGNRAQEADRSEWSRKDKLLHIYEEVLGTAAFDRDDSFENLGGNSILAIKLVDEINAVFPDAVVITDVYSHPSFHHMYRFLEEQSAIPGGIEKNEPTSVGRDTATELRELLQKIKKGRLSVNDALRTMEAGRHRE